MNTNIIVSIVTINLNVSIIINIITHIYIISNTIIHIIVIILTIISFITPIAVLLLRKHYYCNRRSLSEEPPTPIREIQ